MKELKQLQCSSEKRANQQDESAEWPTQHLQEMAKRGVGYSFLSDTRLKNSPWYLTLTDREKLLLRYAMAVNPGAKTIDVSQRIDRAPTSSTVVRDGDIADVCSTLLTGSHIWLCGSNRLLTGWEACLLRCIPVDALRGASAMTRRSLTALAGDAFCGASFGAVLIGIMVHLPRLADKPEDHQDADETLLRQLVFVTD